MKATQTFISTLKEAPADSEIISHQLMTRAGMIRKLGAGIYNYMPIGLRIIRKVEAIVREEMDRAGAIELLMPFVQPGELWEETGRLANAEPIENKLPASSKKAVSSIPGISRRPDTRPCRIRYKNFGTPSAGERMTSLGAK
jgi:hypothetical protein